MSNYLCHFELMVSDTEKAKEFYGKVFDWTFNADKNMPEYTLIDTGKEPGGGLMKKPVEAPSNALSAYFLVDNVDDTLKKAADAGVDGYHAEDEIPGIGYWGFFLDPDGVPVGIFEEMG